MNSAFWTVKIAGVSGIGKTTLMRHLEPSVNCKIVIYSDLLKQFGTQELADYNLSQILNQSQGLVIMDEHLEFNNPNKARNYQRENTRGIILLDATIGALLERIQQDGSRVRCADELRISNDLEVSRSEALVLSRELHIPLLVIPDLDGKIPAAIKIISVFLQSISP